MLCKRGENIQVNINKNGYMIENIEIFTFVISLV